MTRPPQITAAAVITAIGSGFTIIFGAFALLGVVMASGELPSGASREMAAGVGVALLLAGAWGLNTAYGMTRLRPRPGARLSMAIFGGVLAFLGIRGVLGMMLQDIPAPPGVTPQMFGLMKTIVPIVCVICAALGVWWMFLFNSRPVRAWFRGETLAPPHRQGAGADTSLNDTHGRENNEDARSVFERPRMSAAAVPVRLKRPLSIAIISWYLLLGAASSAGMILVGLPAFLMGYPLAGIGASAFYLVMFAAQGFVGIELLHMKAASRMWAVYFFLFGFVNGLAFLFMPGRMARTQAMMQYLPPSMQTTGGQPPSMSILPSLLFSAVTTLVPIWFLITSKPAFESTPPQQR